MVAKEMKHTVFQFHSVKLCYRNSIVLFSTAKSVKSLLIFLYLLFYPLISFVFDFPTYNNIHAYSPALIKQAH